MRNPFTVEALRDWLKTKPRDETYVYSDGATCCLAQYFNETGFPVKSVTPFSWQDEAGKYHTLPREMERVVFPIEPAKEGFSKDDSFGGALRRAEALLK